MGVLWREPKESFGSFKTEGIPFLLRGVQIEGICKRNSPFLKGMKRIPAGILLEGFQIEGTAKGMHSLGSHLTGDHRQPPRYRAL